MSLLSITVPSSVDVDSAFETSVLRRFDRLTRGRGGRVDGYRTHVQRRKLVAGLVRGLDPFRFGNFVSTDKYLRSVETLPIEFPRGTELPLRVGRDLVDDAHRNHVGPRIGLLLDLRDGTSNRMLTRVEDGSGQVDQVQPAHDQLERLIRSCGETLRLGNFHSVGPCRDLQFAIRGNGRNGETSVIARESGPPNSGMCAARGRILRFDVCPGDFDLNIVDRFAGGIDRAAAKRLPLCQVQGR